MTTKLTEKNISKWHLVNKEAFNNEIIEKYKLAKRNNPDKNKELQEIYNNIKKKIDKSKLEELYNILRTKTINFNNQEYKKLFDKLQQQYNLLSSDNQNEYNKIKSFINNTISINESNKTLLKKIKSEEKKSFFGRVKNFFT